MTGHDAVAASAVAGTVARRFLLYRRTDVSGVSGRGVVADGVAWPDGRVSMRWRTARASTVAWDSIDDAEAVHGHDGATVILWLDPEGPRP